MYNLWFEHVEKKVTASKKSNQIALVKVGP